MHTRKSALANYQSELANFMVAWGGATQRDRTCPLGHHVMRTVPLSQKNSTSGFTNIKAQFSKGLVVTETKLQCRESLHPRGMSLREREHSLCNNGPSWRRGECQLLVMLVPSVA